MNEINLPQISASAVVIVPIIVALVQAVKQTGWINSKFAPLVSIGFGVIIGFLADHNSADLTHTILSGAMYGLMASGLYSGVVSTMSNTQSNQPKTGAQPSPMRPQAETTEVKETTTQETYVTTEPKK